MMDGRFLRSFGRNRKKNFFLILFLSFLLLSTTFPAWSEADIYDPSPADSITYLVSYPNDFPIDPNDTRIPLILIHGIHGTKDLNDDGILDDWEAIEQSYWDNFLDYYENNSTLQNQYKIYIFTYLSDRESVWEIARSLRNRLDDAIDNGKIKDRKFVIVAHSMGGLVARSYMNEHSHNTGNYSGQRGGERILRLITLATPHHGTPGANENARITPSGSWSVALDIIDEVYWGVGGPSVTQPNRSDLRWDNYNNLPGYSDTGELNIWLATLNSNLNYSNKIIAYYGNMMSSDYSLIDLWNYLNNKSPSDFLLWYASCKALGYVPVGESPYTYDIPFDDHAKLVATSVVLNKFYLISNDGMVPIDSSQFFQKTIAKKESLNGYDHADMKDGKLVNGTIPLFDQIKDDLLDIATIPTIDAFSVNPNSTALGNAFTISYVVSDSGGSLKQVELWRASDTDGDGEPDWPTGMEDYIKKIDLSGETDYSHYFLDAPDSQGTYWYGLHVVDNAGNWNDERNSQTNGQPGIYGPDQVTVIPPDNPPPPNITVISPNGGESWQRGTQQEISWTASEDIGSSIKIELFKGGLFNRLITSSTDNDESYFWNISDSQSPGSDYMIKITSTYSSSYNDFSDNTFSITQPDPIHSITITSGPSGSPNPVIPGGEASLSVSALDSLGHPLYYNWASSCPTLSSNGTLIGTTVQYPTWIAPENDTGSQQSCNIQVTIDDGAGLSTQSTYVHIVSPGGASSLSISNGLRLIEPPPYELNGQGTIDATIKNIGSATVVLDRIQAVGSFKDRFEFVYERTWPAEQFSSPLSLSPGATYRYTKLLSDNFPGIATTATVMIYIKFNNIAGQETITNFESGATAQLVFEVGHELIVNNEASGSQNPVVSEGDVNLSLNITDSLGHNINYSWSASCTGLASNGSFNNNTLQTPVWTAPLNNSGGNQDCTIQVSVNDGYGLNTSSSFVQEVLSEAEEIYYCDNDNDGYISESVSGTCPFSGCKPELCQITPGDDCDDNDQDRFPGNFEICDGKDNDCDGFTDNGLTASLNDKQIGVCSGSLKTCIGTGGWVNDYSLVSGYEDPEISCGDSLDNDCDGSIDDSDNDCSGNSIGIIDLPQTGQTICYDISGSIIECTGTGQDGDILSGVEWPEPRFTQHGDGTITDNLTGLMWLVDASCLGFRNWNEAFDTVSDFNSNPGNYGCFNYTASHNEWRMPNMNELQSLVNNGTSNLRNWLSGQGFMNVQEARYWSSTTFIGDTNRAWTYYTLLNNNYAVDKTSQYYIWPVRGTTNGPAEVWRTGQTTGYYSGDDGDIEAGTSWPSPRFTDNEDGTVTDNLTGLMWLRDANCIANQYPSFDNDLTPGDGWVTWQHALNFISGMNNETYSMCALGYDDWHLPNITELYSLIDFTQISPSLPADKPFSNIQNYYWSSTTTASQPGDALNLVTSDGRIQSYTKAPSNTSYVWPVRDGNQMELITYYCDIDSDGYISLSISGNCRDIGCEPEGCQLTQGNDCDDNDNSIYIGAPELCDNKPNDCNNPVATDGIDESWYGNLTNCGLGVCYSSGQLTCTNGSQVDTCTAGDPTGDDSDCDNIDDDCDGTADEHYVVITTNCGLGVCSATGQMQCQNGNETDTCTPGTPTETPEATCNDTLDNDCDGYIDTADADCGITTPSLIWKKTGSLCINKAPALGDDGFLYTLAAGSCSSSQNGLASIDPSDGSFKWGPVIPSGCSYLNNDLSVGSNGLVYVTGDWNACGNGRLVAFNSSDGSTAWDHGDCPGGGNTSPHPRQTPALDESLNSLYFGSTYLCSVDMDSGSNNWSVSGGYYIGERGIAIDSTNNVYYGTHNGSGGSSKMISYDKNGVHRWQKATVNVRGIMSGDMVMFTNNQDGRLIATDNNGTELWQANSLGNVATDEAGNLYLNSTINADVVSLDSNGTERWRVTLPGATWAKVDFTDNAGHVYVRGHNILYSLNTSDGSIAWTFTADADLNVGAVLTPGGRIFFSDANATLYKLATSIEYAASTWSVARYGNRRHTKKAGDILSLPTVNLDDDGDGILNDGDNSGTAGDNPCTGGEKDNCDDNCVNTHNPNQEDIDSDGVGDVCDNCQEVENWDQRDTNSGEDDNLSIAGEQHYGNICDPDFDNDGIVSIWDFNEWRKYAGQTVPPCPEDIDLNGDGFCWIQDFNIWRLYYGSPPGPGIGD